MTALLTFFTSSLYKTYRFHVAVCLFSNWLTDDFTDVVGTSVTNSPNDLRATFLFLPHSDVISDLLLNRRTATWNLYVKFFTGDVSKVSLQSHYSSLNNELRLLT